MANQHSPWLLNTSFQLISQSVKCCSLDLEQCGLPDPHQGQENWRAWSGVETSGSYFRGQVFKHLVPPWSQLWLGHLCSGRSRESGAGCGSLPLSPLFVFPLLPGEECPNENMQLHNFYHPVVTLCHDIHSLYWDVLPILVRNTPTAPGCPL